MEDYRKIAIELGQTLINKAPETREDVERMLPELKESEDEKVRKEIIIYLKSVISNKKFGDEIIESWIDWLEKQGEQKPADKVEPKFHEGDWIIFNEFTLFVKEVGKGFYRTYQDDIPDGYYWDIDNVARLWTIQDAKDGDVLACENGWTCIFKTLVNDETFSSYCFMDNTKWFCETGSECHTLKEEFVKAYNSKIYPATKEQRDTLFVKMKEAGYEWDAEKKELKKIEQKPAWSEEDEEQLGRALYMMEQLDMTKSWDDVYNWLKFLKDRVQPQPKQVWSEEDIRILSNIQLFINYSRNYYSESRCDEAKCWLKSLKERYTWKPSDEQMIAINTAINVLGKGTLNGKQLIELYERLKKLKS